MVDTLSSGGSAARCAGSTPVLGTEGEQKSIAKAVLFFSASKKTGGEVYAERSFAESK